MEITRKFILLVLVFSLLQVVVLPTLEATAQSSLSNLTIVSPQNKAYNSKFLTLNVTIDFAFARIESMSYSIGGLERCSFSDLFLSEDSTIIHGTQIWLAALPELGEGPHSITVYLDGTLYFPSECHYSEKATVHFTIDNTFSAPIPSSSPLFTSTAKPTTTPYEVDVQNTSQYLATEETVVFIIAVVCVGLGLLVYLIKRK